MTFVRLLGEDQVVAKQNSAYKKAGWNITHALDTTSTNNALAYGLFIAPSGGFGQNVIGTLGAVVYASSSAVSLYGLDHQEAYAGLVPVANKPYSGVSAMKFGNTAKVNTFSLDFWTSDVLYERKTFGFDANAQDEFIRNSINTNPQKLINSNFGSTLKYWLGESYELAVYDDVTAVSSSAGKQTAILMPLTNGTNHWGNKNREATPGKTGWFINRNPSPTTAFNTFYVEAETGSLGITVAGQLTDEETFAITDTIGNTVTFDIETGEGTYVGASLSPNIGNDYRTTATTYRVHAYGASTNAAYNAQAVYYTLKRAYNDGALNVRPTYDDPGLPNNASDATIFLQQEFAGQAGNASITAGSATNLSTTSNSVVFTGGANSSAKRLFRACSLHDGEHFQNNYAIKIEKLKLGSVNNPNSTFSLVIVDSGGSDVERFDGCNLNSDSENFVARRIGDQYQQWNATSRKYDLYGEYPNISSYIRIEMHSDWKSGLEDQYALPFGVYGPAKPINIRMQSGSQGFANTNSFVTGGNSNMLFNGVRAPASRSPAYGGPQEMYAKVAVADITYRLKFPELKLTSVNSNNGGNYDKNEVFGVRHALPNKNTARGVVYDSKCYKDIIKALPAGLDIHDASSNKLQQSWIFSLDDIVQDANDSSKFYWARKSHKDGLSYSAINGTSGLLDAEIKQFNAPFFGGCDGVDVTLADPFSSVIALDSQTTLSSYANYTVSKAIEIVKDPEMVRYDVISMPGLTNTVLSDELIKNTTERGDALCIVDLNAGFQQPYEGNGTVSYGSKTTVIGTANTRDINNSYVATYYPYVKTRGLSILNPSLSKMGGTVGSAILPPSVAAIGAIASSDASTGNAPWFAPAGFNRGGIKQLGGPAGPKIQNTTEHLTKKDRDDLYEVNINPIARFPAVNEIVIFGQKTMQQTASALDRINVRRLMIYLKKRVGDIANTILFQNNVRATWISFTGQVNPILADIKARFGITEYKLVLDESTTTADLIDRNIMYAKVFIKPARAIEFIAVDFIITKTGIEI